MIKTLLKRWGVFVGAELWCVVDTEEEAKHRASYLMSRERIVYRPVSVMYSQDEREFDRLQR